MNDTDRIEDYHISGPINANLEEIKELQQSKGPILTGLSTGFTLVDRLTTGLNNSDLIILASYTAMGKTTLAFTIARNVAVESGVPVLIFPLESTPEQLSMRMLGAEARVHLNRMRRTGNLTGEDWPRLEEAAEILSRAPVYIDESTGVSIQDIEAKARDMHEKKGLGLIIIDYLQLMKGAFSEQREIARSLKCLAKDLDIPIMLLSQLPIKFEEEIAGESSDFWYKCPSLVDIAESGSLDEYADLILIIHRDLRV